MGDGGVVDFGVVPDVGDVGAVHDGGHDGVLALAGGEGFVVRGVAEGDLAVEGEPFAGVEGGEAGFDTFLEQEARVAGLIAHLDVVAEGELEDGVAGGLAGCAVCGKGLAPTAFPVHQFAENGAVFEAAVHALAADGTDLEISGRCDCPFTLPLFRPCAMREACGMLDSGCGCFRYVDLVTQQ